MPSPKLSSGVLDQILHLNADGKTHKEIAQVLNLKRLQVAAIIAHAQIQTEGRLELDLDQGRAAPPEATEFVSPPEAAAVTADEGEVPENGEAEDGVFVGEDAEYADPIYWVPWNPQLSQNPHLMIIGESGSGKTYATQCLVAELAQAGIPSLIFDYGQGFELEGLDRQFRKFINPKEYLIAEQGLALNPIEIFPRDLRGPNTVASRISDVFDAVYRLGDIQRKVLIDAIINLFEHRNIRVSDPKSWAAPSPSLADLQAELENLASDRHPNVAL